MPANSNANRDKPANNVPEALRKDSTNPQETNTLEGKQLDEYMEEIRDTDDE